MTLVAIIVVLLASGLAALLLGRIAPLAARLVTLLACLVGLGLAASLWRPGLGLATSRVGFVDELSVPWFPRFGIGFHVGADGLSLAMILLTCLLGALAVLASWREIDAKVGLFHLCVAWVLAGIVGVFAALDLFLFYFCWELMLVPMYLLIGVFGHEHRVFAAVKFFIFTQASGLAMLAAMVALALFAGAGRGTPSFDYFDVLGTSLERGPAMLLMLGFFVAFAVKLPTVPLHTWLPDAHTEAPTAGSLILAGLMLKTGAYGLLRFAVPLFPAAALDFAPVGMALGVLGIVYGAVLAFAQTDLKRMVAYTSVSHLGFVLLGVYAGGTIATQGVVMEMVCHGLSTGGLFVVVGALAERTHSRDLRQLSGLWTAAPRLGAVTLVLALASLGLPGLGNFVAELLVVLGAYRVSPLLATLATLGLVLATMYSLWLFQAACHGPLRAPVPRERLVDLGARELASLGVIIALLVGLGLYPQPLLDLARPADSGHAVAAGHRGAP